MHKDHLKVIKKKDKPPCRNMGTELEKHYSPVNL